MFKYGKLLLMGRLLVMDLSEWDGGGGMITGFGMSEKFIGKAIW